MTRGAPFYRGGKLVLNPKCVLFGIALIWLYLAGVVSNGTVQPRDYGVSFAVWLVAYVAMAEYDLAYDCAHGSRMVKGVGPTSKLKSGGAAPTARRVSPNKVAIYVTHIAVAVVLMFASGWVRGAPSAVVQWSRDILPPAAVLAFAYHAYQLANATMHGSVVEYT